MALETTIKPRGPYSLALFLAWNLALLARLAARREWLPAALAAALAAVLALAVQTDAYGVPWLAFCLWGLAGALARPSPVPVPFSAWRSTRASTSATST